MAYSARTLPAPLTGNPADFVTSTTVQNRQGVTATIGTPSVTVTEVSDAGYVLEAYGATVPTAGDAGYEVGAKFRKTTAGSISTIYFNEGTAASALFVGVGDVSPNSSAAINATATATAAQVATGRITSTSAAATTITLPTGTLLGAALGASAGTVFDLIVDNTAGANTVTMAVAVNGIKSDAANTTAASFGQLTVASGVTGIARFTLMFSSATAYVFTRTA